MHRLSIITPAFVLIVLLLAASPLAASWNFLPAGTPSFAFVSDSSAQRIFLSSYYTGLWRTTNGGQSWDQINARLVLPNSIPSVWSMHSVDPRCDSVVVSLNANVPSAMYSADGGTTWQQSPEWFRPLQHSNAYRDTWFTLCGICAPVTLLRSHDRGLTWPDTIGINDSWRGFFTGSYLYQHPFHDSTLLAVLAGYDGEFGLGGGGVYRSDDLGSTWSWILRYEAESANVQIAALSNDSLIVTINDQMRHDRTVTLVSTDGGATWDTLSQWRQYSWIKSIIADRFHPGQLLMSTYDPQRLYRSVDFGNTWNESGTGLPADPHYTLNLSQDFYSGMVTFQSNGLYTSRDFGETWSEVPMPPIGEVYQPIAVTPEAVFLDFSKLESPYDVWQTLSFPESAADTFVTSSPVIFKHADTLATLTLSIHSTLVIPRFVIYRMAFSYDDGASWSFGPPLANALDLNGIKCVFGENRTRFMARRRAGSPDTSGTFFLSDDLGGTWRTSYVSASGTIRDYVASGSDIYLAASTVMHSSDDGVTWQPLGRLAADKLLPVGTSLLAGVSRNLYVWQDSAWVTLQACPGAGVVVVNTQPPLLVAASTDTLYVSSDTGLTWQGRYIDIAAPARLDGFFGLTYDPYRQRLRAMTYAGSCYLDLTDLAASDHPLHFQPADHDLLSVYPNPFNSEARITYDLESRGRVQLDLFNLEGRLIRTLSDEIQEIGRHELHFSGAGLSSGIYFARLVTPTRARTQKIVLLK
jgi:photosystem II stability/assembly factor-like uncharacterized protein